MAVKREQLKEIFTYHAPDDDQVPKYAKIRLAGQALAEVILECTPVCGDQQVGDSESGGRTRPTGRSIPASPASRPFSEGASQRPSSRTSRGWRRRWPRAGCGGR